MKVFNFQDVVYQNVKMISKFDFISRRCVDISEITSKFLYEMFVRKKNSYPNISVLSVENFDHRTFFMDFYLFLQDKTKLQNLISKF